MKGVIANYRMGRHTQTDNHMIVTVSGVTSKEEAAKLVGKTTAWTAPGKNNTQIKGTVKATHGNSGAVRVIFERGMPGQSIGQTIDLV